MGLPHSEIRGSQPSYRLLSAYRRFLRPSSPLNAKASIMCPLRLGHAYLAPSSDPFGCLGKAGHATSDFASSDDHVRVRLLTRAGSSMYLEIVLGSYIAIAVLGRSPHAGRACVGRRSGTRDHRFTCQRTQTTRAGEGSQMVTRSPMPSRGCSASDAQKIADLDYWRVATHRMLAEAAEMPEMAVFPATRP